MYIKISLFISLILFSLTVQKKTLKQVVILSRHNVRTPLGKHLEVLTPNPWPKWKEKSGYLTEKGFILEGYMGKFFFLWLYGKGLLPKHCPDEEEMFVYANVKQRTMKSAEAFVKKAYPGCNITIHHKNESDPVFDPVIHNSTEIFKEIATKEMELALESLKLNSSLEEIENILDYKDSKMCKEDKKCDLTTDKNTIDNITVGEKPNLSGPLKIGNWAIDSFKMQYYEGFPLEKVAWGKLTSEYHWQRIMKASRGYHNVILNTTSIAKDISEPLLNYMSKIWLNKAIKPKVLLIMAHDANLYTVLNSMKFKPYVLPEQNEIVPIGGKIVFQKWFDENSKLDLLKINYVYQSSLQLRNGEVLSLDKPPQFASLELNDCKTDEQGFCLWSDFEKLLNKGELKNSFSQNVFIQVFFLILLFFY